MKYGSACSSIGKSGALIRHRLKVQSLPRRLTPFNHAAEPKPNRGSANGRLPDFESGDVGSTPTVEIFLHFYCHLIELSESCRIGFDYGYRWIQSKRTYRLMA